MLDFLIGLIVQKKVLDYSHNKNKGLILLEVFYQNILDEPTSNLDSLSEEKIYDMINKYLNDKTLIIVTHRPKLRDIYNKHYYFKNKEMIIENKNPNV